MFKRLFSRLRKTPDLNLQIVEQEEQRPARNCCLFISGTSSLSTKFGVFYSSLGPGIRDHKNGILYIAPEDYMQNKVGIRATSYVTRNAILEYYGIEYEYKPDLSCFKDLHFD